jgi:OOP family OmpA-OmpF porin
MKLRHYFLALAVTGLLTACMTLEPAPQFVQELNKQYQNLSLGEVEDSYDWTDTEYFRTKGQRALAGKDVQPEDPATWGIGNRTEYLPELNNAYDMLQIALVVDEKKVTNPVPTAQAQAYFDCWVEQSQEKFTNTDLRNQCRAAFYEAMCRVYSKSGGCKPVDDIHRVFFDLGSTAINAEGMKAVADAVRAFKVSKSGDIVVAGHADKVGNAEANMKLSLARAEAVKAKLVDAGVPASKISTKYFGEGQPLVPTPDDVPNRNNRRVLIVVR